jgi:hypothetical protein
MVDTATPAEARSLLDVYTTGQVNTLFADEQVRVNTQLANVGLDITDLNADVATVVASVASLETAVDAVTSATVPAGDWSAASGAFPSGAEVGTFYNITVSGTVGGQSFVAGWRLFPLVDNASTSVYAGNWSHLPAGGSADNTFELFTSRSAFTSASIPANIKSWSVIVNRRKIDYVFDALGTAIESANGIKGSPAGDITPEHFGAVGGYNVSTFTGTNDSTALLAMVAHASINASAGRTTKIVLSSTYLTNSPLIFNLNNVQVVAESGSNGSAAFTSPAIVGGHTSGPVVQFRRSKNVIEGIAILATPTRSAAAYSILNAGIIVGDFDWTSPTTGGSAAGFSEVTRNLVRGHPGPGILTLGGGCTIERNYTDQNSGSGILADNGQGIGFGNSSGLGFPGWSKMELNKSENNGGHGIQIGWLTADGAYQVPYRWEVNNNDVNTNCSIPANCQNDYAIFIRGDSISAKANVASYDNGIYADGFDHSYKNNRFVGTTGRIFAYGPNAHGIIFDGCRVVTSPALNPAVAVDAAITAGRGNQIRHGSNSGVTTLLASGDVAKLASIDNGSTLTRGGIVNAVTLQQGGVALGNLTPVAITPSVTFATAGNVAVTYNTRSATYVQYGNLLFLQVALNFDLTYTTASGAFLISLPGLPGSMDADEADRTGLSIVNIGNITFNASDRMVIARPNAASQIRLEMIRSATGPVVVDTSNVIAGNSRAVTISGWVRLA